MKFKNPIVIFFVIVLLGYFYMQWPTHARKNPGPDYMVQLPGSGLSFYFEKKAKLEQSGELNFYHVKKSKVDMFVQELELQPSQDPVALAHKILADDQLAFKSQELKLDLNKLPAVVLQNAEGRLAWVEFYWQEPWLVKVMLVTPSDVSYRDRVVAIREKWPSNELDKLENNQ